MVWPKRSRVQTRNSFLVEEVGRLAALIDKIPAEVQIAPFLGEVVEAQKRQLYLWMPAVAANLAWLPTETRVDIICKAPRDLQQAVLSGRFKMNYGGLDQVAGAVELMQIPSDF